MEPGNQRSLLDTDPRTPTDALIPPLKRRPTKLPPPEFDSRYLPLLKSIVQGQWDSAESFLNSDKDALKTGISESRTALHVAVGQSNPGANGFVDKMLNQLVAPEDLRVMTDRFKRTVLHEAALAGNLHAVRMVVKKNRDLLLVPDDDDNLPIHWAAMYGHKDVAEYLLRVTPEEVEPCPFTGDSGFSILDNFIEAEFYDLALKVVDKYPELATVVKEGDEEEYDLFALGELARTPSSFYSGIRLHLWQRFLYHCVPIKSDESITRKRDIENLNDFESPQHLSCWSKLFGTDNSVPYLKHMYNLKTKHSEATRLLECLCKKLEESKDKKVTTIIRETLHVAAESGIYEIVEQILKTFPFAMWYCDDDGRNLLDVAILNRREKVFNLIYQMSEYKFVATQTRDDKMNHSLHLAAQLGPSHRLNRIPGAALQMQYELQWFKGVKKFIKPSFVRSRNRDNKTPQMIFSEEHKDLIRDGEKWMNGMATSCITAATLLTTLAFAAAITIPGGVRENDGKPILFYHQKEDRKIFLMFVASNAISLFSSVGSIIMFLSILTSRYAEKDFLYALPRRLILGLASLFTSITSMMIAFGGAVYLIMDNDKKLWLLALVGVLAWLPVTLFVTLQFPLLLTMVKSTFGPSIFGAQNKAKLY